MSQSLDANTVAHYLKNHPEFFDEHLELLTKIKLHGPTGERTVSLQERQMTVLREKIKALELKLAELVRIGQDNDALVEKFQSWTHSLLATRDDAQRPLALVDNLLHVFDIPYATLRLWDTAPQHGEAWFAAPVSPDQRLFGNGLRAPYCGSNQEFEVVGWLGAEQPIASVAIIPLRRPGAQDQADPVFGLLLLASPDPQRFTADMSTDYLSRVGETASTALAGLLA